MTQCPHSLHAPHSLPTPLPPFDRKLLRLMRLAVPAAERDEWLRSWQAELWHQHHHTPPVSLSTSFPTSLMKPHALASGLIQDALWLRTESWRQALAGTATLCLATLLLLLAITILPALVTAGSWKAFAAFLAHNEQRFAIETLLIVFVSLAASAGYMETTTLRHRHVSHISLIRRPLFFAAKTTLIMLFTFMLSTDVCLPLHAYSPLSAELLQNLLFLLMALIGLRWSSHDGEARCKQCLRSLAAPSRVGRPSHNFLEWSGTELVCRHGHGMLTVPEIETSWCRSSAWICEGSRF
ncbi:MAG TPA: hypothetical protein VGN16_09210 [Acidobacteriaceae bacterium]|jgi:hypothetical protein